MWIGLGWEDDGGQKYVCWGVTVEDDEGLGYERSAGWD